MKKIADNLLPILNNLSINRNKLQILIAINYITNSLKEHRISETFLSHHNVVITCVTATYLINLTQLNSVDITFADTTTRLIIDRQLGWQSSYVTISYTVKVQILGIIQ